jgi:hypothetical protein
MSYKEDRKAKQKTKGSDILNYTTHDTVHIVLYSIHRTGICILREDHWKKALYTESFGLVNV